MTASVGASPERVSVALSSETLFMRPCFFYTAAPVFEALPEASLPEFAFIGRSNVGKSSLINALVHRRKLVRTGRRPGQTRQLNFFNLAERLFLVDLPGYGYAAAPVGVARSWHKLTRRYLATRRPLRMVFVLVEARLGLGPQDRVFLEWLADHASHTSPACLVLTKADKKGTPQELGSLPSFMRSVPVLASAKRGTGLDSLRELIFSCLDAPDRSG